MTQEQKNKTISTVITIVVMILIIIFLSFCSLKSIYPPPPPRKVITIEMHTEYSGGGGGGGNKSSAGQDTRVTVNTHSRDILSAHDISLPSIPNAVPIATSNDAPVTNNEPVAPSPNPNAQYRPGMGGGGGTGSGGGTGTGHGTGFGSGVGAGTGSGSGGGHGSGQGIGYGSGNRGYTHMPNLTINEVGKVYVEVHVSETGTVTDARVINNSKYPTTITNSKIQQECVAKAKTARYKPGNEELRIIVFSL